ncbi:MAG: hypothetical protein P8180_16925, partial [Gammaproteobacteria bacterium]
KTTGTLNHKTANALGVSSSQFAAFEAEVGKSSARQQNSPGMKGGNSTGNGASMNGSGSMSGGHGMAGSKPMGGSNSTGSGKY